jgi:hypothetical protein
MLACLPDGTPAPVASDGKPFVLPNIFPGAVVLNFTGRSDKITAPAARFGGPLFGLQAAPGATETFLVDLLDGIYLAGGHVDWEGGSWGSFVHLELMAPATTTKAPAVLGHGNCNKVATGYGFNIIVPAAGNGEFDLDVPVPVPASDGETEVANGYWAYSEPWLGRGVLTPSATPTARYNLFDQELELAHFAEVHLAKDIGTRDLAAGSIKPKWILPEWHMRVEIYNADVTKTLKVVWDFVLARRRTT